MPPLPNLHLRETALILAIMTSWFCAVWFSPDHGREAKSPDFKIAEAAR
jgi:hypothetical protein